MQASFYTLGCKVNQYETELMREQLEQNGYTIVPHGEQADVMVVNSCTVTAESDRKTRQLVRRCRRLCPDAVVVLTGCMPQAFPEDAAELTEADIILGNQKNRDLVGAVERFYSTGNRIIDILPHKKGEEFGGETVSTFSERTRAYMKVEDGCNRGCTYCIIPKARGRVRSKSLADIENEAVRLAEGGFSEIVLVGINLSSFGTDRECTLADAVQAASKPDGIKRVRLGSLEPDLTDDELLNRLNSLPKFCPQFHLSLQSGCDTTLKRMNRCYDTAFYKTLCNKIRGIWPNAAITTDIMVGFAGETEEEFATSLGFALEIGFAKAHVFPYSRRTGTMAAGMPDQISVREKEKRSHSMSEQTDLAAREFLKRQIGTECEVLFESQEGEIASGYSENYTRVSVKTDLPLAGNIMRVQLTGVEGDGMIGNLIK